MKDFYGSDATRLKDKKLFLFDMDGTIYLGENLFVGVPELLQKIENKGSRYVFITNNASKSVSDYVKKLHRLGLTNVTEEHFFTSAQAMLMLLKEKHANELIYLQGTKSLVDEYIASGLNITTEYTNNAGAIVVAFDTELTGDRCYTDIASGNNAGVDTVCVLSGEVTLDEVNEAQGVEKPTFLLNHVKEIEL